jgi:iron-sulfur cluster repair protein YtfE (RIC family)
MATRRARPRDDERGLDHGVPDFMRGGAGRRKVAAPNVFEWHATERGDQGMDVFKLLKQDHAAVAELFKKLEETTERAVKTREKTFKELAKELTVHTKLEEEIFYPRLREEESLRELINEAYEEHHMADQLLEELAALATDDEQWEAKLTVLKEVIEHHVEEEEKELFPKAAKVVEKDEAAEMGQTIAEEKKGMMQGAHKGAKEVFARLGL